MNREVHDRIMACTSLPAMPPAALRVLETVDDDDCGLDKLAAIIGQDAALSSGILRAINSGFYGTPQKLASIQQAVSLVGLPSVKALVLGLSLVMSVKAQQTRGPNHVTYWRRSMYCASAARLLAARVLPNAVEDCFVAALLMDLGTLVLDRVLGEAYEDVCDRAKTHGDLLILEAHAIGITHAEAGGILARKWKLPPMMEVPIAAHHGPEAVGDTSLRRVAEVVSLAGRCADVFVGERPAETIASLRNTLLDRHQIGEADGDALLCEVGRKTADLGPAFGVPITPAPDYESIREKASQRLLEISLARGRAADLPVNKRRNARMRRDGRIPLTPCANGTLGKQVIVRLKDLSACGIGLTHSQRLERGTQFIIQLPQPNGLSKSLLYTVSRCEMVGGMVSIGAELTAVLRPEAIPDEPRISSGQAVA